MNEILTELFNGVLIIGCIYLSYLIFRKPGEKFFYDQNHP